jgi:hypothetical protein
MKKPCSEMRSANTAKDHYHPKVLPSCTALLVTPYTTDKQLSRRKDVEDKTKHEPVPVPRQKRRVHIRWTSNQNTLIRATK